MTHEVTVGQAASIAGVPLEVQRAPCEEGQVPAAVRRPPDHWYLLVDAIPDRQWVTELVQGRYRERLVKARPTSGRCCGRS